MKLKRLKENYDNNEKKHNLLNNKKIKDKN